ncbi:MAG: hypothetical protein IJQ63_01450 [Synergistaceae bacterium]|nr:hypothetical protein [Synergistaceae bacterium]MBQ6909748.1 hypothetical protein [Synergistaceae bacterium]MBR0096758.1 hypothetical protein [Synergistaceae bacterium]MBR0220419.1 hypothetical protein [Synergistaceae bacterium]
MIFTSSVELNSEKSSRNVNVDLIRHVRKKTPEKCEAIIESVFREREAAFDMLARY